MIKLQGKLPKDIVIAVSGGIDSMAILDFLKNNHNVTVAYFDHKTPHDPIGHEFVQSYCFEKGFEFISSTLQREKRPSESYEEFWRNERYSWFHSMNKEVVVCHHLDDCIETWIWSSLHGKPKIIPYANKNCIRPFLLNTKSELKNWCVRKNVPWAEDESNLDKGFIRNYIRHELMQNVLVVNPGIHKVIRKKVIQQWNNRYNMEKNNDNY
jgi:tRNA(Ile)-lysidine synthase